MNQYRVSKKIWLKKKFGGSGNQSVRVETPRITKRGGEAATSIIFDGGSGYDWMVARPKIREKFVENECWDIVERAPLPAAVVAAAAGLPPAAPVAVAVGT